MYSCAKEKDLGSKAFCPLAGDSPFILKTPPWMVRWRLSGKGLHQHKNNSCRLPIGSRGRAEMVDTAGCADRSPVTLARGRSVCDPFLFLALRRYRVEIGGHRPKSRTREVGRRQNRNPSSGRATCADPPSLCAGWGCRGTLQVPVPGPSGETPVQGRPRSPTSSRLLFGVPQREV